MAMAHFSYFCSLFKPMEKFRLFLDQVFSVQFIRFVLVAMLNTAVGWGVFALLRFLFGMVPGIDPLFFANLFGTVFSVLFNFKTYGTLVFRNKSKKLIFKFVLSYTVTFFINYFSIRMFKDYLDINNYIAAAVVAIPVGLLNYLLNRFFVFSKNTKRLLWAFIYLALTVELIAFTVLKVCY
jgi:putative flippase GtrA